MKRFVILFKVFAVSIIFFAVSCTSDEQKESSKKDTTKTEDDAELAENVSYQIPSPEELFIIIKQHKLPYKENLLNSTETSYTTTIAKEINLGIYVADLSYSSVFNMNQNTLKYFQAIYKLSENLGISSVVSGAFLDRLKNNLNNPDSMSFISNGSYYSIIQDLDNAGKGKTIAVVATGGWVEGLYILTNLVDKYSENNQTINKLASQKVIFNNLYSNLEKYSSDANVADVKKDMDEIKAIFDQLKAEKKDDGGSSKNKEGVIVLGNKEKFSFSEAQYNDLKLKIKEIRTKFIKQ
ncbi:MAG: hypothetical protein A2275_19210 [Bacteroidetes bacterium RIFOXYA12_FULL_35_11]|nr:MAG: hypothetical protein A2X01_10110 [Bacteroidetes bacterium GWF2_35_48]OFY72760.1 MAG: hypothetical protein A2275_19210 [Bacteroidetes bacterium RIFOXYA12_FULL_35_11]OFY97222.1 MAG: hypothetical protein A2309_11955 [Bacteroidetes bacterium RIFOXYB2_FULL_35_7]OFY97998.1 MAG: hypothetical protein A2491_19135 [Bacteroidetes bacterium RIFOXYC12_FULL_35_7]HBX49999.1 hypothetical protein [Bacteroidales bacterium]